MEEDDCDTTTSLQGEGTHYSDVTANEEGLVHKILDNLTRVPVFPHDNFRMTNFGVEFQPSVPPKKIKVTMIQYLKLTSHLTFYVLSQEQL